MELRQFFFKTLIVLGTLIGLYLLFEVRGILMLFFGAILFASTIRPAVVALQGFGVPPILSILAIYLAFIAAIVGIIIVLFPSLFGSVEGLINSQATLFAALDQAMQRIQSIAANGAGLQVPMPTAADIQRQLTQIQADAQSHLAGYLLDTFALVSSSVILFVMAFYWLTERDRFEEIALRMLPVRDRERFIRIVNDIETTLGAFVRGQVILCVTVGALAYLVLTFLNVRSALVLAVFATVAEAIPMIGPILGAIPALLVALLDSPEKALFVGIGYLIIQQFESQILVPKVMERQVGLSPLLVLLALTSGDLLGGIPGALIAIPIAAAGKILFRELVVTPAVQANQFPVVDGAVLLTENGSEEAAEAEEAAAEPAAPTPTILIPPK